MKAAPELPALWGRITAESLATLTGAHITTARRWKRARRAPRWLETLVRTVVEGWLCAIAPAWRGWRVVDGILYSPEGWSFTPGEVRALPLLRMQLRTLQVRERLPAQGDWISGRIEPLQGALVHDAAPRPHVAVADLSAYAATSAQRAPDQPHSQRRATHDQRGA
jgi:hypothetical protein